MLKIAMPCLCNANRSWWTSENPKETLTPCGFGISSIHSVYPPPRMLVTKEGLGWDSLLKMEESGNGDCYWMGG